MYFYDSRLTTVETDGADPHDSLLPSAGVKETMHFCWWNKEHTHSQT